MKPTVYIETTIPSYLTAWRSRDLIRAAHQEITREWWERRDQYELYSSRLVIAECQSGDEAASCDHQNAKPQRGGGIRSQGETKNFGVHGDAPFNECERSIAPPATAGDYLGGNEIAISVCTRR